jgi:hypothetical protein
MGDVDVKVKISADTTNARAALTAFNSQVQPKAGAQSPEADTLKAVNSWMKQVMGSSTSYLEQRKKLLASYRDEIKYLHDLEHELGALQRRQATPSLWTVAGDDKQKMLSRDVKESRKFTEGILETMQNNLLNEQMQAMQKGGGGLLGALGGSGGLLGAAKGLIMRNPITAATIGLAMTGKYLKDKADQSSEYSETLDIGYTNLGRRMGKGTGLRGTLEGNNAGHVTDAMKALGYSGVDVLKMGEGYGLPGFNSATAEAHARFARGFGIDPGEVSGIGKRATQLGVAEPGQQAAFFRMMTDAVMHGQKAGMDASDAMRTLLGLTEDVAAHTGVVSREYVAGLSGIQKVLQGGESRFFKQGPEATKSLMDSLQHPQGILQTRVMQTALMSVFGDKVPDAKALGLTGHKARIYDEMTEQQKLTTALDLLPEISQNKHASKEARNILPGMFRYLKKAAGGHEQLALQSLLQMQGAKGLNAQAAMREAVGGGAGNASTFGSLEELFGRSGEAGRAALVGTEAPAGIIELEKKQQVQAEAMEGFSKAVSAATLDLRTGFSVAVEEAARVLGKFVESFGNRVQGESFGSFGQSGREQSMRGSRSKQAAPVGP